MTKEDVIDAVEIMNAWISGEKVQCRLKGPNSPGWQSVGVPSWDWNLYEYRVRPLIKAYPSITDFLTDIVKHTTLSKGLRIYRNEKVVMIHQIDFEHEIVEIGNGLESSYPITLQGLTSYTYEDGYPCGLDC